MPLIIPTKSESPLWEQRTSLEGREYVFTFKWNDRDKAWYFNLATGEGAPIRNGIKLVANWPLLRKVVHPQRPPGELMVVAPEETEITRDNLGGDVVLTYIDQASLSEAGNA